MNERHFSRGYCWSDEERAEQSEKMKRAWARRKENKHRQALEKTLPELRP